jgi:hypothetical protein
MEASSELKIGYFVSIKQILKAKEIKLKQSLHTFLKSKAGNMLLDLFHPPANHSVGPRCIGAGL